MNSLGTNMYLLKRYRSSDSFYLYFWELTGKGEAPTRRGPWAASQSSTLVSPATRVIIVHIKVQILSSFTHPQVSQVSFDWKKLGTMEVNGYSKYIILCSTEDINFYRDETIRGWLNDD